MDAATLQAAYKPLLRRNRALELAQALGATTYSFRILCETKQIKTRNISKARLHYYRDSIISIFLTTPPTP